MIHEAAKVGLYFLEFFGQQASDLTDRAGYANRVLRDVLGRRRYPLSTITRHRTRCSGVGGQQNS